MSLSLEDGIGSINASPVILTDWKSYQVSRRDRSIPSTGRPSSFYLTAQGAFSATDTMKASRSLVVLFSLLLVLLMACLAVYGTSAGVENAEDDTHGFNSKAKFARDNVMPNELEATEEGRRLLMNGCAKCGGEKCCPEGWYCKYGKCVKRY